MQRIKYSLLVCVAVCALAWQGASAASGSAGISAAAEVAAGTASERAPSARTKNSKGGSERSSSHAQRKTFKDKPAAPEAKSVATHKTSDKSLVAEQKAAAREQAESGARANRLYQSSQFSAPIVVGATACRRTGGNGESIYENC